MKNALLNQLFDFPTEIEKRHFLQSLSPQEQIQLATELYRVADVMVEQDGELISLRTRMQNLNVTKSSFAE